MNAFERVVYWLQAEMPRPENYGWFHLMCIGVVLALCALIGIFLRDASDELIHKIVTVVAISMVALEIYKQVAFSFIWDAGAEKATWDFQWFAFPFQFCASPMYVSLLVAFSKKGKFRDCLYSYLATFTLFAGIAVYAYPDSCFTSMIGINIHTMYHHGMMIVLPVLLLVSGKVKFEWMTLLKATFVFILFIIVAMLMNWAYYAVVNAVGAAFEDFTMFYISPYSTTCPLPVVGDIRASQPYLVYLFIYVVGFIICAGAVFAIPMYVSKLVEFFKNKSAGNAEKVRWY